MQFDTLRAFPYPVLRPDVDDYVEGDIQVVAEFSPSDDGLEVKAQVSFLISVDELKAEIKAGRAVYAVVFACRDTYFRHVHTSAEESLEITFPSGHLRGEVQVYPYVTAVEHISDYSCDWINGEFGNGPFSYEIGAVLAIDQPKVIFIDRDVFRSLLSVFVLMKDDNIAGHEWQIKAGDDKVQILVSPDLKCQIDEARNNKGHRAVLMNSIYFSAVMQCFSFLKSGDDSNESRWGRVILHKCHNAGIEIDQHDEYLIAERLVKNPFQLIDAYVFQAQGADK